MNAETAAALLALRGQIMSTDDPLKAGGIVSAAASLMLEHLGFPVSEPAEVLVEIGTDACPEGIRMTLTWPLPPGPSDGPEVGVAAATGAAA